MANLSHLNFTVLLAFAVIPSRICTHIASVLKPAMGIACPLMCMYKSHTKKCDGNAPMIVLPSPLFDRCWTTPETLAASTTVSPRLFIAVKVGRGQLKERLKLGCVFQSSSESHVTRLFEHAGLP